LYSDSFFLYQYMTKIHPLSFALGLASGAILLVLTVSGFTLIQPVAVPARSFGSQGGQQMNIARTAERLGMTEEAVQKELDSGKTMREIMEEHGEANSGARQKGSGSVMTGSGTRAARTSSGITSPTDQ
jgi:hypothetical protein